MPITDWTTIKPHLAPLAALLDDDEVTNIECNPGGVVFYEKGGRRYKADDIDFPEKMKFIALQNIARLAGQNIDEKRPSLTTQLPSGDRIAGLSHRVVRGGNQITIRRFPKTPYSLDALMRKGVCPPEVAELLRDFVANKQTILIAGGTNAGKTTLLNALCGELPDDERIITIEDNPELRIFKPNVVQLQALEGTELTTVTIRDLLKETLRHNPDRIIIGELRHGEAFDFIQAANTGHPGTITSIHSDSAYDALERLADLVLQADVNMPYNAICRRVARAVSVVVYQHYDKQAGTRSIREIIQLQGYDQTSEQFKHRYLYKAEPHSHSTDVALPVATETTLEPVISFAAHA